MTATTTVTSVRGMTCLPANVVYVGRPMARAKLACVRAGSPLCNPKSTGGNLHKFLDHLTSRPDLLALLPSLRGKCLACWCGEWDGKDDDQMPACHAALIAFILNNNSDEAIIAGEFE